MELVSLYAITESSLCFILTSSCQIPCFSDFKILHVTFLDTCPVQSNINLVHTFDVLNVSVLATRWSVSALAVTGKVLTILTLNCMHMASFLSVYRYPFCVLCLGHLLFFLAPASSDCKCKCKRKCKRIFQLTTGHWVPEAGLEV